jgi:hypothetical protein
VEEGFIDSSLYLDSCPDIEVIKYSSDEEKFLIKVRCGRIYINFSGSYEIIAKMISDMQLSIEKVAPATTETTRVNDIHNNIISEINEYDKAVANNG